MVTGRLVRIAKVPSGYLGKGDPKRDEWFVLSVKERSVVDWFDTLRNAQLWCEINGLEVVAVDELVLN